MYLFCPIGNYNINAQNRVSKFFERLLNNEAYIVINSLVLSEFTNAYLRIDFNLWKEDTNQPLANFKNDYFDTERSKEQREIISNTITNKIIPHCQKHPDSFNSIDISQIMEYYKSMDFNDSMIADQCLKNGW